MSATIGEAMDSKEHGGLGRLRRICRIGAVIGIFLMALALLSLAAYLVEIALSITDSGFHVDPMDNRGSLISGITGAVEMGTCFYALLLGYRLVKALRDERSPFLENNVRMMRDISITLTISFVATLVLQVLLIAVLSPFTYIIDIPLHFLAVAGISYAMYLIFEYGTVLQTESDDFL